MADYAILTASNATSPVQGEYFGSLILSGRSCVPIFWFALFRASNLTKVQWEKGKVAAPYLMERREVCLGNFARREVCLFQALPDSHRSIFAEFYRLLDQTREEYIHCDPQFVGDYSVSFDQWLMECLIAFDGPPPIRRRTGVSAFFLGSGLSKGWENMIGRSPRIFEPWQLTGASEKNAFSWEADDAQLG